MASVNRGRYSIELGDGWKRFLDRPLHSATMLGTVRVGDVEGALVRHIPSGDFTLVGKGRMFPLLARKVESAIDARKDAA